MKKFLFVYNMSAKAMEDAQKADPNAREETMKQWMDWSKSLGDKMIDLGQPTMPGKRFNRSGDLGNAGTELAGYSIVSAADINEAKNYLESHPHLTWSENTTIDIHELMPM